MKHYVPTRREALAAVTLAGSQQKLSSLLPSKLHHSNFNKKMVTAKGKKMSDPFGSDGSKYVLEVGAFVQKNRQKIDSIINASGAPAKKKKLMKKQVAPPTFHDPLALVKSTENSRLRRISGIKFIDLRPDNTMLLNGDMVVEVDK